VKDPSSGAVTVVQSYGQNCKITNKLQLSDGFFETTVKRFQDNRSFAFSLELAAADHISLSEDVVVDSFITTDKSFITLQTFNLDKRTLGGVYRFKIVDAFTFKPLNGVSGTFLFSPTE
jgi:hypothetical protein